MGGRIAPRRQSRDIYDPFQVEPLKLFVGNFRIGEDLQVFWVPACPRSQDSHLATRGPYRFYLPLGLQRCLWF
jgi:hypothetical protein